MYVYIYIYIYICRFSSEVSEARFSGKFPVDLGIPPPLRAKKLPASNPLKSRLLVPELTVSSAIRRNVNACRWGVAGTRRHLRSVLIISVRETSN